MQTPVDCIFAFVEQAREASVRPQRVELGEQQKKEAQQQWLTCSRSIEIGMGFHGVKDVTLSIPSVPINNNAVILQSTGEKKARSLQAIGKWLCQRPIKRCNEGKNWLEVTAPGGTSDKDTRWAGVDVTFRWLFATCRPKLHPFPLDWPPWYCTF